MVTKTWPYPTDYHEWIAQTNALRDEVARLRAENQRLRNVAEAARQLERVAPGTPTDKPYQLEWLSPMGVNRYMAARAVLRAALAALDGKEASGE